MSKLSLHLFNLYLLHSLHTNRRGGGGGSKHILSCYLIVFPPIAYILTHYAFLCILSLSSVVTVFGKAGGKENNNIFFHSMGEGGQ